MLMQLNKTMTDCESVSDEDEEEEQQSENTVQVSDSEVDKSYEGPVSMSGASSVEQSVLDKSFVSHRVDTASNISRLTGFNRSAYMGTSNVQLNQSITDRSMMDSDVSSLGFAGIKVDRNGDDDSESSSDGGFDNSRILDELIERRDFRSEEEKV